MKYPPVIGEWETLQAVCAGSSIARFGDGELKLMEGAGYRREPPSQKLAAELRTVLTAPHARCICGIPTLNPDGPKYTNWLRHRERFLRLIFSERVQYYSAFISRPDSAPWIRSLSYARMMESLWGGKRVAVISEPTNKILAVAQMTAAKLQHIECPTTLAYSRIAQLEQQALEAGAQMVLMSCGPTATCLANRLAAHGQHAVDIGSAGGFLLDLLQGPQ